MNDFYTPSPEVREAMAEWFAVPDADLDWPEETE